MAEEERLMNEAKLKMLIKFDRIKHLEDYYNSGYGLGCWATNCSGANYCIDTFVANQLHSDLISYKHQYVPIEAPETCSKWEDWGEYTVWYGAADR